MLGSGLGSMSMQMGRKGDWIEVRNTGFNAGLSVFEASPQTLPDLWRDPEQVYNLGPWLPRA